MEELHLGFHAKAMPQGRVPAKADVAVLVVVEPREHLRHRAIEGAEGFGSERARLFAHHVGRERLRLAQTQGPIFLGIRARARERGRDTKNQAFRTADRDETSDERCLLVWLEP